MTVRSDILAFLRETQSFTDAVSDDDARVWLRGLTEFAQPNIDLKNDWPLRSAQSDAWKGLANKRTGLILGPPGTGKTHLLSWLVTGYLWACREANRPCRILITAFTRNAIGNLISAVYDRNISYLTEVPDICYLGSLPPAGLNSGISTIDRLNPKTIELAATRLEAEQVVFGATIWSLYRLLESGKVANSDGPTAPVFDLICIDEASQMVLGHGLMALSGMADKGRVVVAGDDQQLPPIRSIRDTNIGDHEIGGSIYSFLKSVNTPEFPLDETFRLNAPLTSFPEAKFYQGQYRSAKEVQNRQLEFSAGWEDGLDEWEKVVLDPSNPVCILLHDGPLETTSNPFEAEVALRLASSLRDRLDKIQGHPNTDNQVFWQDCLAVITPHRAQAIAIKGALGNTLLDHGAVVETIDRIQGKERDAIIASYCVSDPEFAQAEAEFLFSRERFNVAITRAKSKLIIIMSKRLFDVVPTEQGLVDNAELVREFVFSCTSVGETIVRTASGLDVTVDVRVRSFTPEAILAQLTSTSTEDPDSDDCELTSKQEQLLQAIREESLRSQYGSATERSLQKILARDQISFSEFRKLHQHGLIEILERRSKFGEFYIFRPLDPPRRLFGADRTTVEERIEEVIIGARKGKLSPFYTNVRDRFAWIDDLKQDVLLPIIESLVPEGKIVLNQVNNSLTVDLPGHEEDAVEAPMSPPSDVLSEEDFAILNTLEDLEAERINFGIVESWTSLGEISKACERGRLSVSHSLGRLQQHGYLMIAEDARIRSRIAEIVREVRYVKQRFRKGDADNRPYLVRNLKIELRGRNKPRRDVDLLETMTGLERQFADDPVQCQVLRSLGDMLVGIWGTEKPKIAGFQARSLTKILLAWHGRGGNNFVITADTGAGKTEAACLPLIAGVAADRLKGSRGTRVVFVYPRIRLVVNQAQRLVRYLSALAKIDAMPIVTIGMQYGQVPRDLPNPDAEKDGWVEVGRSTFEFPLFACPEPSCGQILRMEKGKGDSGADRLVCTTCSWHYDGWIGTKRMLGDCPPDIFLPTVDSLHQWLHNSDYGSIFGDSPGFLAPRAILADEIHLYGQIHGAQVGQTLQRLMARAELNRRPDDPCIAIGMSATLGDPASAWGRLIFRDKVHELKSLSEETDFNPKGREYYIFIQPEVESRGHDIAGASTTIQSLMCIAHGMRRRTSEDGGYRGIVFLDSIDKLRRLHSDFMDAEMHKRLASYRVHLYDDDPGTSAVRTECCGEPVGCDAFRAGECWYFAAVDERQWTVSGRYISGQPLKVVEQPIFSGTRGKPEALIQSSDIVFSTSSLEVGYDDPDIGLVYQHYAPHNLASFIQRKGRGGRGTDDRPVTGVTLSVYSPRDSWYFRKPENMLSTDGFDVPLNPDNFFVRRGQVLATMLDGFARYNKKSGKPWHDEFGDPCSNAMESAALLVEQAFGKDICSHLGISGLPMLWKEAVRAANPGSSLQKLYRRRQSMPWIPNFLFETINLPALEIVLPDDKAFSDPRREDISLAFSSAAPGNITRRYSASQVHWTVPTDGDGPWLDIDDYRKAVPMELFGGDADALTRSLPSDAQDEIAAIGLHPKACRPTRLKLAVAGRMFGADWQENWMCEETPDGPKLRIIGTADTDKNSYVGHKSRGILRGFVIVDADQKQADMMPHISIQKWVDKAEGFRGRGVGSQSTGLKVARVYWGADSEVRIADRNADDIPFRQTFLHPTSGKVLLHGYDMETEGVRIHLKSDQLDDFVDSEIERFKSDEGARRWHVAQFLRFLVESRAQNLGLNSYEARRGADLFVSAAGDPELRKKLGSVIDFWDQEKLTEILQDTGRHLLSEHPLLSERRITRIATSLSDDRYRILFQSVLKEIASENAQRGYVRSLVIHGVAVRLKQSFVLVGRGDESKVLLHAKLPIQFGEDANDIVTIAEVGAYGDGTARAAMENFEDVLAQWHDGTFGICPNASQDALVETFFGLEHRHAHWRELDPNDKLHIESLASELRTENDPDQLASVLRILFGVEAIGFERFNLIDLAKEIRNIGLTQRDRLGRAPTSWELVSAVTLASQCGGTTELSRLHACYENLEEASQEGSLSANSRLADQIFRLSASLCVDGCQACLHQGSDLMTGSLVEASVSRSMLERYLSY
jgi:hypothetical protein